MARIALFTTCKPFRGSAQRIQSNALASWKAACPGMEILVFGDEPGVAEQCEKLGLRQISAVSRSEYGTPLLDGLFRAAERATTADLLAYVNADIMLTEDLMPPAARVLKQFPRFLLIARRWNVNLETAWDFSQADWGARLDEHARIHGELEPVYGGMDLFVFPRGLWEALPPFAIGRGRWDSALIYHARRTGVPVVDATEAMTTVHQNHDYSHIGDSRAGTFKGSESCRNETLLGGEEFIFTSLNATHVLDQAGLRRYRPLYPPYLLRRLASLPALYPSLRPISPVVRLLAPVWRWGMSAWRRRQQERRPRPRPLPYPISVSANRTYPDELPEGGGVETFDKAEAVSINTARIEHLRSLNLPVKGRTVIDVGCGVGHLAKYFVDHGCDVLCVDGRSENIDHLRQLYPTVRAQVFDLERQRIAELGQFDIVFCYGLLYHVENPFRAIREFAAACKDLLIIETQVCDHALPVILYKEETSSYSQALRRIGSRPSPSAVALALRESGFKYVYAPHDKPDHPDFRFAWKNDLSDGRDGHLLRAIFVASRRAIHGSPLVSLLDARPT